MLRLVKMCLFYPGVPSKNSCKEVDIHLMAISRYPTPWLPGFPPDTFQAESWLFNRDPYVMVYEIIPT